jgi:hypothetical protein
MAGKHRPGRAPQRVTETSDYVAMMTRIIQGFGNRIAEDPAALAHLRDLQAVLTDAVNRGIFAANKSDGGYSQYDMARILGVSQQAIGKRAKLGEAAHAEYWQQRENAAPMVRLADVRTRRAELLAEAGVADVTGSVRELRARAV